MLKVQTGRLFGKAKTGCRHLRSRRITYRCIFNSRLRHVCHLSPNTGDEVLSEQPVLTGLTVSIRNQSGFFVLDFAVLTMTVRQREAHALSMAHLDAGYLVLDRFV